VHFKTKKTPKKRLKNGAQIPTLHLLPLLLSSLQRTVPEEASIDPVTKRRRRVLIRRATEALPRAPNAFPQTKMPKKQNPKNKTKREFVEKCWWLRELFIYLFILENKVWHFFAEYLFIYLFIYENQVSNYLVFQNFKKS
jgi:hypothetical protein